MSKRDRKHKQRPVSASNASAEDIRRIKNHYQYYRDAASCTDDEYYESRPLTEKERRTTEYVYGQSKLQHSSSRERKRRNHSNPPHVKYTQKERKALSASGHQGVREHYVYDMSDDEYSYISQPVVRERGREIVRRPHSSYAGERITYTYNDGRSVLSEDMVSQMSNIVIKDKIVEKPIYIELPKQFRNVGVQMTTKYIAPEVKPPKKVVRNVGTQTLPPPPPPPTPPRPLTPSPPSSPPPKPPARIEVVKVEKKPEPIYVTVPVEEEPIYYPIEKKKPEPVVIPISLRKKKKPVLVRVGGGWVTQDYHRNKYYPLRVVELDSSANRLKDKYLFVKSAGTRRRRHLQDLAYEMYRERPKTIPDYPF